MIFPVFVYVMLPFCPESPRWLAAKGASVSTVASVLALLDGENVLGTAPHIVTKAKEIVTVAQAEAELDTSWTQVRSEHVTQDSPLIMARLLVVESCKMVDAYS